MASINAVGLQISNFTTTGNWNFDGTNFDVSASGIGQVDALNLNLGISLASTMVLGNTGCNVRAQTNFSIANVAPVSVGGAVGRYLVLEGITTAPSTAITAGYGMLAVNTGDGNLYYFSGLNQYQLTPPVSPNSFWAIGGNSGLADPTVFGTTSLAGINHRVNSQDYLTVSSGLSIVLAPGGTNALTIGFTGLPVQIFANTLSMDSNGAMSIASTGSTLNIAADGNLNIGCSGAGTQTFGNVFHTTFMYGNSITSYAQGGNWVIDASVEIHIGISPLSGGIAIGDNHVGSILSVNAPQFMVPNMPPANGGEQLVVWDPVSGQLRHT